MRRWLTMALAALGLALGLGALAANAARADAGDGTFQIALSGQIASSAPQTDGTLAVTAQLQTASGSYPAVVLQLALTERLNASGAGTFTGTAQVDDPQGMTTLYTAGVKGALTAQGVARYQLTNPQAANGGTGGVLEWQGAWRQSRQGALSANASGVLRFPTGVAASVVAAVWPGAVAASPPADPTLWYLTRGAASAAYILLTLTTALGIGISTQAFDSIVARWRVLDLHQVLTLTMVALVALHLVTLALDPFLAFSVEHLFWPVGEPYLAVPVGLGVLALYALAAVTLSSWLRRWLRYGAWRAIHYLSLPAFVLLTLHGLLAGTDAATPWMTAIYVTSSLLVAAMLTLRIVQARSRRPRATGAVAR